MPIRDDITGVILAGGQARRMGGEDKGLIALGGRPMIEYALAALEPQVGDLLINANRNHERYAGYGFPVLADRQSGYCGPLAGMVSAMAAARTPYLATVPCDCPQLPGDLVERLAHALGRDDADIAVAHDGERMQPVFALIKTGLFDDLESWLDSGERKIDRWYARHRVALADFSDCPQTFENVNTLEERDALWTRMSAAGRKLPSAQVSS
ncbi:MAG: molybdenum cofactor guanylyltransferase MobA [Gammaproteobacteria bacterium]